MSQHYSNPKRANDPHALPDMEIFKLSRTDIRRENLRNDDGSLLEAGWYYWYGFPGCLPDSDPVGPFPSEDAALADARESAGDDGEAE